MDKPIYDKKLVPDAPVTLVSELQKLVEHMMINFRDLPPGEQKDACQSGIDRISTNLNELRSKELSGDVNESSGE